MKLTYLFQNCGKNLKHPVKFIRILILQTLFFSHTCGMQDLSSQTRNWTHTPAVVVCSTNHWTTKEVPIHINSGIYQVKATHKNT